MMSVATETLHQTSTEVQFITAMSESGSEASKVAKKREYNRNAQRVFRQRRKEHLSKLEAAQRELNSFQGEEVERLRQENQLLAQENEALKATYGSQANSPGPSITPVELRASPSGYVNYVAPPAGYLGPATANASYIPVAGPSGLPPPTSTPMSSASTDPSNLVVVVPFNISEIRQSLHQMFAPILEIPVISNPQTHLATLAALEPTLPPPLKPTPLQLSTPHHAYIDMIPSPALRNQLITVGPANSNSFLTEACTIACDIEDTGQMIVWGEDWLNDFSWEFSPVIFERWGNFVLGPEWIQRANFWRRQRGAPLLPTYD
jgi:BMFP domain-containing protein YqiC